MSEEKKISKQATSSSNKDDSGTMYKKRDKIYPRETKGVFSRLRNIAMLALLGIYYGLAWLQWDSHQAILFDLPARKFYIFDLIFWPQDFFLLTLLLIVAAYSLFFFTALAGRLWCGYACPQTVWTEIFLWFERKIEGSRQQQIKLDKQPISTAKLTRKISKHVVWLIFSLWTGFTFVGYFTPIRELTTEFITWNLGPWETFWIFFYGFATYGNAGWLREQVCIYMCPYARFQSAMFDKDTLLVAYDEERGDPRGARKKGVDPASIGKGDCIDCKLCVQVCPTGIDIRDGLQYQCIGCAACIDVCDEVMDKVGYPRGLVRYTTDHAIHHEASPILRPRVIIYAAILLLLLAAMAYAIVSRNPVGLDIIRDRNTLYNETPMGLVENVYTLKVVNMTDHKQTYELSVSGLPESKLLGDYKNMQVASGEVGSFVVRLQVDPIVLKRPSTAVEFHLQSTSQTDLAVTETGKFLGPLVQ
ncbi:MAG: cytochrome c oxidase accessory protein CcoG [gamma proteobacterium symbiont of Bathyaustriella thionipta]|nr:cytochrome c oxidase accessory protein CcoG [gamma proteobacterium symbiont of Bathyaustriella thionipta]